ncbi:hypothetical protein D1007_62419 [Hordeum vulgare]|uniref:Uncharacterized protein n=1 Tax=Hordeum vulgare subsp. vulgare TaxID=112509 RepID=A0A8I6WZ05_HORVV|nr:hypothetical protein D1007_62419 [Hordeum vulgare]KAI5007772.1 hypothetical protein ZWY2020_008820 [Hordeum vulgare]
MVYSKNARRTALLFLAVLLLSCAGMGRAARGLEETAPEDDYPAEAPESSPEDDYSAEAPEVAPEHELLPPFPSFPKVELPPMPEMPTIPGFSAPEPEAEEP